jgi:hypothetical protein
MAVRAARVQVMAWLMGARMISFSTTSSGLIWIAQLQYPAGALPRRAWLVWSPASTTATALTVPAAWEPVAHWQDAVDGKIVNVDEGAAIPVGKVPVLVVSYL